MCNEQNCCECYHAELGTWPTPCPTCFAEPSESCITGTGKWAIRHRGRYADSVP